MPTTTVHFCTMFLLKYVCCDILNLCIDQDGQCKQARSLNSWKCPICKPEGFVLARQNMQDNLFVYDEKKQTRTAKLFVH